MERRPNIRANPPVNPKYLPKNEPPVYNKDEASIEDLYIKFTTLDINELKKIINSGINLNFRDKEGRTLIHAVIKNNIINEIDKIYIIKELTTKNVSINAMDKFNKNPLHYAASENYINIIEELIKLNCDINLIDNDGNSPIHIIVEKFVTECGQDDVFNDINKKIKLTSKDDVVNEDLTLRLTSYIAEYIKNLDKNKKNELDKLLKKIGNIVKLYKLFKYNDIKDVYESDINNFQEIFLKLKEKNNIEVIEKLINSNLDETKNKLKKIYETVEFNKIDIDFFTDKSIEKKIENNKNIDEKKNKISKNIVDSIKKINDFTLDTSFEKINKYLDLHVNQFYLSYYLFYLLMSEMRPNGSKYHYDYNNILENYFKKKSAWTLTENNTINIDGYQFMTGPKKTNAPEINPNIFVINDIGYPIVNKQDSFLVDNSGNNITEPVYQDILPDFSKQINKFSIKYKKNTEQQKYYSGMPYSGMPVGIPLQIDIDEFNLEAQEFLTNGNSTLINSELSLNPYFLQKVIDYILGDTDIIDDFIMEENVFNAKNYIYFDIDGKEKTITGSVYDDNYYVNTLITSNKKVKTKLIKEINLPNETDNSFIGIPLMKFENKVINFQGSQGSQENREIYKGDVLYLFSNFDIKEANEKQSVATNQTNYNFFADLIEKKIDSAVYEKLTFNKIFSDLRETTLYNEQLFNRGQTDSISNSSIQEIINNTNIIHPYVGNINNIPNIKLIQIITPEYFDYYSDLYKSLVYILKYGKIQYRENPGHTQRQSPPNFGDFGGTEVPDRNDYGEINLTQIFTNGFNSTNNSVLTKILSDAIDKYETMYTSGAGEYSFDEKLQNKVINYLKDNNISSLIITKSNYLYPIGSEVEPPSDSTLQEHLNYRRESFIIADKKYREELENSKNEGRPVNSRVCMNYILALTVLKILEKNLPYGFEFETKIDTNINYVYKYNNITTLISLIKSNIKIIKKLIDITSLDEKNIQRNIIDINLFYAPLAYQLIINNLNNLVLLEKYFDEYTVNEIDKLKNKLNEFDNIIKMFDSEHIEDYSKKLIRINFISIYDNFKEKFDDNLKNLKNKSYLNDINNIYKENITLLNLVIDLSKNNDELLSVNLLKKYDKLNSSNQTQQIYDIYTNRIDYKNKFPLEYNNFKDLYYNQDSPNILLQIDKLIPKNYFPTNYNELYFNSDIKPYILKITELEELAPENFENKQNSFPSNDFVDINSKYLNKYISYRLPCKYFFNSDFKHINMDNYKNNDITTVITTNNNFVPGYLIYTDYQGYINYTGNSGYVTGYLQEKPLIEISGNFNEDNKLINYIYKDNKYGWVYDDKDYSMSKYNLPNVTTGVPSNSLTINYNDEYVKPILLYNIKEVLTNNIILYIEIFLLIVENDNDFYKNLYDKFILTQKDKENYEKIIKFLENDSRVKKSLVVDFVSNYIKLYLENIKLFEINDIVDGYYNYIDKGLNLFGKIYEKLRDVKDNFIGKGKKLSVQEIFKLLDSETLDKANLMMNQSQLITTSNNKRVFGNKCTSPILIEKFIRFFGNINLRKEDLNGNTILNRFIDQFNSLAIEKLLNVDPGLKTYPNSRGQNSSEYSLYKISVIQNEYTKNLDTRIKQYSQVLQNQINTSSSEKLNILNVDIDDTNNLIYNIVMNSIYLFSEFVWVKMLNFPGNWTWADKTSLNQLLRIQQDKENLLIKTVDKDVIDALESYIKTNSNFKNVRDEKIKVLEQEKTELENQIKGLEAAKNQTKLLTEDQINNLIAQYKTKLSLTETNINKYIKLSEADININITTDTITKSVLIKGNSIDYSEYEKIIGSYKNFYYPLIVVLNKKIKDDKDGSISNSLLEILKLNYTKLPDDNTYTLLNKFYTNIINNVYAEYEDFDKYEDCEYNTVNQAILSIVKINVIGVVGNEMFNILVKYCMENSGINNQPLSEVPGTPDLNNETRMNQIIKGDIGKKLFEYIKEFLQQTMYVKLKNTVAIFDPEKTPKDVDLLKNTLIKSFEKSFVILFEKISPTKIEELNNIISFYQNMSDNIGLNVYNELVGLLQSHKKISLLLGIYSLLQKK